jgi:hypothetical protein
MQLTPLPGYPDLIGRRQVYVGYGAGPASYSQTTGDVLIVPGYEKYIDCILEAAQDPTGTYYAVGRPNAVGFRATWSLHWFNCSNSVEVANATNLSTFNLQISLLLGEC